jgi:predicted nucleotidyltransferase
MALEAAFAETSFIENTTLSQFGTKFDSGLTTLPNNGLGMEYCKANALLGNCMEVYTTHRTPEGPRASAIRRALCKGEKGIDSLLAQSGDEGVLPPYALTVLREAAASGELVTLDDFGDMFRYTLFADFTLKPEIFGANEGLVNRFRRMAMEHPRLSDLLFAVKTKRYTLTRLQRYAMCAVLGVRPPENDPPYIRILGFRKESAHVVGEITRRSRLPVLTHGAAMDELLAKGGPAAEMLEKEFEAGDIYRLVRKPNKPEPKKWGFRGERGKEILRV